MTCSIHENFLELPSPEFIASLLPISHFKLDLKTEMLSFDKNFGPMLGLSAISRMSLNDFLSRVSEVEQEYFKMHFLPIKYDYSRAMNRRFLFKDDNDCYRCLEWNSVVVSDLETENASGKVLAGIIRLIDDDENLGHRELQQSERWFMEVLEESPHAMYRIDIKKNRFDYVSKGFADSLGMTREEILTSPYSDFMRMHPEDIERLGKIREEIYKSFNGKRMTIHIEFRYQLKTGRYIWLEDTFTLVPGPNGEIAYQVGFGSVIEDRKKLEEALRKSNELLEERVLAKTSELQNANKTLIELMHQRRELEKKLLEISERERRFMGRELHDGLCQQIVGVMCMFEALRTRMANKKVSEESELKMMRDFLQDAVMQIRTLSRGLCPLALEPNSVGAALSTLAAQTSVLYKVDCKYSGSASVRVGDADAALHLYRITQEAIQNGIRHGGAKKIAIDLVTDSSSMNISIKNNGKPLSKVAKESSPKPLHEAGSGLGLKLIDYRVGLLGGSWKIEDQPDNDGVLLTINAPIYGDNLNEVTNA